MKCRRSKASIDLGLGLQTWNRSRTCSKAKAAMLRHGGLRKIGEKAMQAIVENNI